MSKVKKINDIRSYMIVKCKVNTLKGLKRVDYIHIYHYEKLFYTLSLSKYGKGYILEHINFDEYGEPYTITGMCEIFKSKRNAIKYIKGQNNLVR